MSFTFERIIQAPTSEVWSAILHRAAFWQESQLPASLRQSGVLGVSAYRNGDRFELTCDAQGGDRTAQRFSLTGTVHAQSPGETVVRVRVGIRRALWWQLLAFSTFFVVVASAYRNLGFTLVAIAVPVIGSVAFWSLDGALQPRSQTVFTHYLIERLDSALDALDESSITRRAT
jgi:hypothetical protein